MIRRVLPGAAAALLVVLGVAVAPARPAVAATGAELTLLDQSPFVARGQTFHMRVGASGAPADTRLQVVVFNRLTTRTDFDTSLKGKVRGSSAYVLGPQALSTLPADPAGGSDVDIPVDPTSATGPVAAFTTRADSGVYPVQVRLVSSSGQYVGAPLTTYLVYVSTAAGFPKLSVALTVPLHQPPSLSAGGRPVRLTRSASSALAGVVNALAGHPDVPVTLAPTPQTLDTLAGGPLVDRATLAAVAAPAGLAGGGDQVLPTTYASVSLPALVGAGLADEVVAQVAAGAQALGADLRRAAPPDQWTVEGPLDQMTLETLVNQGVKQLVVPEGDLSALPESESHNTLARPTLLSTKSGGRLSVIGSDDQLASHFTDGGDQVLAANQLLAELAMIQLETPGDTRGVAVVPPSGWRANSTFLNAVLSGLTGNPLLAPVTTGSLFATIGEAGSSSSPTVRSLTASRPGAPGGPGGHSQVPALDDVNGVRAARAAANAVAGVLPAQRAANASLARQVLIAESDDLSPEQRRAAIGAVTSALGQVRRAISLPGAASITLTARDGALPITVVSKAPPGAQIQLRLNSQKLTFQPFTPAGGHCSATRSGVEVCLLSLPNEATTLKVPVVARTSGVFSLDVALASPDGSVILADSRDTVRSTAFSGVGVILIVVAGAALAFWWVRNIRHGRRARDLVPADVDGHEVMDDLDDAWAPSGASGARASVAGEGARVAAAPSDVVDGGPDGLPAWLEEDPVIAEFFSSPAPEYPASDPPATGRPPRRPGRGRRP